MKAAAQIDLLRKEGYEIHVRHFRAHTEVVRVVRERAGWLGEPDRHGVRTMNGHHWGTVELQCLRCGTQFERTVGSVFGPPCPGCDKQIALTRHEAIEEGLSPRDFSPRGGLTSVTIKTPSGTDVTASSQCSIRDGFNQRLGLEIAFGRAMKEILSA